MSWTVVKNEGVIAWALRDLKRIAMRMVILDMEGSLEDYVTKGPLGVDAAHKLEIRIYDWNPTMVSVYDAKTDEAIGFYVWGGGGDQITSSKDERVVLLANQLEREFGAMHVAWRREQEAQKGK